MSWDLLPEQAGSRGQNQSRQETAVARPFSEEDIPEVAGLHRKVFATADTLTPELESAYERYFKRVFFQNPWRDSRVPSWVFQDRRGRIAGFLGVMPRPMTIGKTPALAAVSSQFIVDRGNRLASMAGVQLLRAFLSGPQDLSLADEANDVSRKLWETFGGVTALLYSMSWERLLQPSRLLLSRLREARLLRLALACSFVPRFVDAVAARLPQSPLHLVKPALSGEELGDDGLLLRLQHDAGDYALAPVYDSRSLGWLLDTIALKGEEGRLRKVVVKNALNEIAGWYVWRRSSEGVGEVVQIGFKGEGREVLDHLFYHAWKAGATALSGRLDPRLMKQLWEKRCLLRHGGYWVLVHSRKPEIMAAIHQGNALLGRLEGEWCMRFEKDRAPFALSAVEIPIPELPILQRAKEQRLERASAKK